MGGRRKGADFTEASYAAGLEARRGGAGATTAKAAKTINDLEITMAEKTLPQFAKGVTGAIKALEHIVGAFSPDKDLNMSAKTVILDAAKIFLGEWNGEEGDNPGYGGGSGGKRIPRWGSKKRAGADTAALEGTGVLANGEPAFTKSGDPMKDLANQLQGAADSAHEVVKRTGPSEADLGAPLW